MNYNYLKKSLTALCMSLIAFAGFAQQLPLNNLYYENRFLFNPANAGDQGYLVGFLDHRRQWVGLEGAPVSNIVSVHSPLGNKNMGLGGTLSSDRTDLFQRIAGSFTYAYRVNFSQKMIHSLAFGLSVGFVDNRIDFSNAIVEDESEPLFQSGSSINGTTLNFDFGLRYNIKNLELGFAIPQLFETQIRYKGEQTGENRKFTLRRAMVGYLGYKFIIKEKWYIQPSVLLRSSAKAMQIDGNVNLSYKDIVWLGATYRTSGGIIPSIGFKIADQFTIAYSYEFAGSNGIASRGNGTHEVMAGFRLSGGSKKNEEQDRAIEDLKANQLAMIAQIDSLKAEQERIKVSDEGQNTKLGDHQQRIDKLEKDINDLNRKIDNLKPAIDTNQIKDMFKRMIKTEDGSYKEVELEKGYYVVIESFKTIKNAEKAVGQWDKKSVKAIIVHNEKRGWYYVYSERFDALDPALKEMKKVRASGLQEKAWVHIYK